MSTEFTGPWIHSEKMFSRRRSSRCKTAILVVLSLLFSQLALASYVCPSQVAPVAMADMMASGAPCAGADVEQPGLCHQHAAEPAPLLDAGQMALMPLAVLVQVLVVPMAIDATAAVALPHSSRPEARPPPDPLFLSTLRLRV